MKFRATGTFETETIIDIAQRLTAVLQDADVVRVQNLNVYLTVVDKSGAHRSLQLGDETIDAFALDCADLACAAPPSRLKLGRPSSGANRRPNPANRRRS